MTKGPVLTHLLLGLCAFLILIVGAEWAYLNHEINKSKQIVQQPVDSNVAFERIENHEFLLPPQESFSEIVERPLMIQGRRPVSEADQEPIITSPVIRGDLKIKLMGIVMTPNGMTALLQDGKGAYQRVEIEGLIEGWELEEMYPDRVVLKQGDSREELKLRKPKPKNPIPNLRRGADKKTETSPKRARKPLIPGIPAQPGTPPQIIPGTPQPIPPQ